MKASKADLDLGEALFDAVRLHTAGDVMGAGLRAIPAIRRDPVAAGGFLVSMVARALHAYGEAVGRDPGELVDEIWAKPERGPDGGER